MRKIKFIIFGWCLLIVVAFSVCAFAEEFTYVISATSGWIKTPYKAIKGKELIIAASGKIQHSWMSGWHGPDGNSAALCVECRVTNKCNVAALIMKIGEYGKIYCVDPILRGKAPASGSIYFAINDFPLNDNKGSFTIKLYGPGVTIGGSTFDDN